MTNFQCSRLAALALIPVLSAPLADAAFAQSPRPLTIRKAVRPAPMPAPAPLPARVRLFESPAPRPMSSWAWASMASSPVWSYNERFNGPLDRRFFISGPSRGLFFF